MTLVLWDPLNEEPFRMKLWRVLNPPEPSWFIKSISPAIPPIFYTSKTKMSAYIFATSRVYIEKIPRDVWKLIYDRMKPDKHISDLIKLYNQYVSYDSDQVHKFIMEYLVSSLKPPPVEDHFGFFWLGEGSPGRCNIYSLHYSTMNHAVTKYPMIKKPKNNLLMITNSDS